MTGKRCNADRKKYFLDEVQDIPIPLPKLRVYTHGLEVISRREGKILEGHHHHHHFMHWLPDALDAYTVAGLSTMFSYSFFASWHCAGMCGPLVCAALGQRSRVEYLPVWLYNGARLIFYPLAGVAFGALGGGIQAFSAHAGVAVTVIVSLILLFLSLRMLASLDWMPQPLPAWTLALIKKIQHRSRLLSEGPRAFLLGAVTVLLPCMTLSPALLMAAGSQDPVAGALLLFAFVLGTVPVMLLSPSVPLRLSALSMKVPKALAALAMMMAAVWVMMRLNH